jgi:hypothetical protein
MLEDIGNYIETNIPALVQGNNLFLNHYPDEPDEIVTVIASGGYPPDKYMSIRELKFEIKIRSKNYSGGWNIGNQIMELFHGKERYVLGAYHVLGSTAESEVTYLYADSKERDEFTLDLSFLISK